MGAFAEPIIQFPVSELGGCGSKEECHAYCDEPANQNACLAFAERNGLMTPEEVSKARKFLEAGSKGPGGCTSKNSCEAFCNDTRNMRECIVFAEQTGMMSGRELDEARKVMRALESGATLPGGCTDKASCDAYCSGSNPAQMKECIAFAKTAGLMSEEELREVDKILGALEQGIAPPRCRGDEECALYCADHVEECIAFGLASGMMTEEDAAFLRKTGGRGPGGCLGEACETFCNDPANEEACFNFSVERGDIPPQDFQQMREGRDRFKNDFQMMPAEVQQCLRDSLGEELDRMLAGNPPSQEAQANMGACFATMRPPEGEGFPPPSDANFMRPPHEGMPPFPSEGREFPFPPESAEFPREAMPPFPPQGAEGRIHPAPQMEIEVTPEPSSTEAGKPMPYSPAEGAAALLSIFLGMFLQ
ncbi:hypothetical protein C4552_04015 [Candidatus Parcubacteria bacterium]|nr:MAG: hypothetical protein C4552_04015 [Candidatus Parcubacteria bacterium]